jgi:hypothetical protein
LLSGLAVAPPSVAFRNNELPSLPRVLAKRALWARALESYMVEDLCLWAPDKLCDIENLVLNQSYECEIEAVGVVNLYEEKVARAVVLFLRDCAEVEMSLLRNSCEEMMALR